jgi:transposase-like protein
MEYSKGFKERMVERMCGIDAVSATALSGEVGVPQSTLSRWLREAVCHDHPDHFLESISTKVTAMPKRRPQDWTPEEKFQVVLESSSFTGEELGAFLRSKGLHESHLEQWRSQMLNGLHGKASGKKGKKKRQSQEMRELRKELAVKEKALAETAALLVLKKKAQSIWGDEDESIPRKNAE